MTRNCTFFWSRIACTHPRIRTRSPTFSPSCPISVRSTPGTLSEQPGSQRSVRAVAAELGPGLDVVCERLKRACERFGGDLVGITDPAEVQQGVGLCRNVS